MKREFFLLLFLLLVSCSPSNNLDGPFNVTRVVDGDTFVLNTNEKVRISGINTPEKKECYYEEAKQKLEKLTYGKEVYLEKDYSNKGKYGRLLRYVFVDNQEVNFIMVQEGYAKVYDKYAYDTKKYSELKKVEQIARTQKLGVWNC